jgi:hypothetical protein
MIASITRSTNVSKCTTLNFIALSGDILASNHRLAGAAGNSFRMHFNSGTRPMKLKYLAVACATLLLTAKCATALAATPDPTTEPLVQPSDLVYQGSFQLPHIECVSPTYACFAFGGTALAYDPVNNGLFVVGHIYGQLSAEITIPTPAKASNVSALPTATMIQPFTDALEGKINTVNPTDPNPHLIGGQLVYGGRLIISVESYYDADGTQSSSHFARPLDLSTTSPFVGPVRVGPLYPGFVSGYMTQIPAEWQSLFGGPALTGNCCLAIAGRQSNGPSVSVFNPDDIGTDNPVPATVLVGYPHSTPLGTGWATQSNLYNGTTNINGIVFPDGTRSVLFFGSQGIGPFCYGPGTSNTAIAGTTAYDGDPWCYDLATTAKGTHAYPYVDQVWAYDANDLLKVKNGTEQDYQVTPYDVWTLTLPYESTNGLNRIGGVAYDPTNNLIFISESCPGNTCNPVIDVYQLEVGTQTASAGNETPSPPTNVISQ